MADQKRSTTPEGLDSDIPEGHDNVIPETTLSNDALEGLSSSQRQSLHEFSQVTNVNDLELAVRVLSSRQWNTQQAIQMYYEPGYVDALQRPGGSTDTVPEESPVESSGLRRRDIGTGRKREYEGEPPSESADQRPQFALTPLLVWPFVLALRLAALAVNAFLRVLGLQRIAAVGVPGQAQAGSSAQVDRYLEQRFGVRLPFFRGSLAGAKAQAQREQKYLVVVLWSREHDDADAFGRALAHPDVGACMQGGRFVVWLGDLAQIDAYAAAEALRATRFPSISIMGPAAQPGSGRLELLARMRAQPGPTGGELAQSVVSFVSGAVAQRDLVMRAARREQQGRDTERRLREQQNAAYEASLARDRERDREQRAREAEVARERAEREEQVRVEQQRAEQQEKWRWATLARLEAMGGLQSGDDRGKLSLRLEDGRRVVDSFPGSLALQHVFDYVETRGVAREWAASKATPFGCDLAAVQMPEGYEHTYEFALVSQFPRKVFDDRSANLKDALLAQGLWPSAALIVEPLFEPEDE
ncbi:Ubx domain-containing protein [Coemansia erecta]|nr:Ubx domain-containing protein [Coemansia erecta]